MKNANSGQCFEETYRHQYGQKSGYHDNTDSHSKFCVRPFVDEKNGNDESQIWTDGGIIMTRDETRIITIFSACSNSIWPI
jgi:hypothetical protein